MQHQERRDITFLQQFRDEEIEFSCIGRERHIVEKYLSDKVACSDMIRDLILKLKKEDSQISRKLSGFMDRLARTFSYCMRKEPHTVPYFNKLLTALSHFREAADIYRENTQRKMKLHDMEIQEVYN